MKTITILFLTMLFAIVFVPMASAQVTETTDKEGLREMVRDRVSVNIIVTYKMQGFTNDFDLSESQRHQQRRSIAEMHEQFERHITSKGFNINVGQKMVTNPRISLWVDKDALEYLFDSPLVLRIEHVRRYRINRNQSTSLIGSFNSNTHFDITGAGQTIVIVDTGVDHSHSELYGRVIDDGACFSTHAPWDDLESLCQFYGVEFDFGPNAGKECSGVDGCEHGTHVAGIAAGSNGVAPVGEILSIQVATKVNDSVFCEGVENTPCLEIRDPNLEAALERIYTHYWVYDPVVVNLSLGDGNAFTASCDTSNQVNSAITTTINNLFNQGTSIVAASGNEGHSNGIAWPACLTNVISVGSVNKQDQHASSSNAASYLDLVAPGVDINSTVPGNGYSTMSGTSMAAPHVAGTIALLSEAYPFFNPTTIRSLLQNTAEIVPEMFGWAPTNEHGWGRLNTYDATLHALSLNPEYRVIDYSTTYSDLTIVGETIFVLPGVTLTVDGSLTLEESQLVVLGTLAGSSSSVIYLLNASQPEFRASGVNAFGGSIVNLITEYESQNFSSNSTIFVPPHTVTISGTTTIDENVILYLNSQVVLSGTVNGGNGSRIIVSDALEIQAGTILNNVQLVSDDDGFIIILPNLRTTV